MKEPANLLKLPLTMPQIENSPRLITPDQLAWRQRVSNLVGRINSSERIETDDNGLEKAKQWLAQGKGLIIVYPHFSMPDPFVIGKEIIVKDPFLSKIPMRAPVGEHQYNILWGLVAAQAPHVGAVAYPVITKDTLEYYAKRHMKAKNGKEKYLNFLHGCIEGLKNGEIILLAPQAGRENLLTTPEFQAMNALFHMAENENLTEFGLLFTGLELAGAKEYGEGKTSGINKGGKYIVKVGPFYTAQEALTLSGGRKNSDMWTLRELAKLAPEAYIDRTVFPR